MSKDGKKRAYQKFKKEYAQQFPVSTTSGEGSCSVLSRCRCHSTTATLHEPSGPVQMSHRDNIERIPCQKWATIAANCNMKEMHKQKENHLPLIYTMYSHRQKNICYYRIIPSG